MEAILVVTFYLDNMTQHHTDNFSTAVKEQDFYSLSILG